MRKKWKETKRQKQGDMVSYIVVGTRDAQVASIIFYLPTTPHKLIEVTSSVFCYSGKDSYTPRTILSRLLPGFVRSCSVTQRATRHRGICWLSNELVYELGKTVLVSFATVSIVFDENRSSSSPLSLSTSSPSPR